MMDFHHGTEVQMKSVTIVLLGMFAFLTASLSSAFLKFDSPRSSNNSNELDEYDLPVAFPEYELVTSEGASPGYFLLHRQSTDNNRGQYLFLIDNEGDVQYY